MGTVFEAGRDKRFVRSPSGTVHERAELESGDEYRLDPKCGQTLPDGSLWSGFDAETAEQVAKKYGEVSFCSKCFSRSLRLGRMGREARR
jgi:hypothetical protein